MKRIKLLFIFIVVFLCLSGCKKLYSIEEINQMNEVYLANHALNYVRENYTPEEVYPDKVVLPRGKTKPVQSTIHGELPKNSDPYDGYIIINKKSKVFHRSDCPAVKKMKESNKEASSKIPDELIAQGYKPCGMEEWR